MVEVKPEVDGYAHGPFTGQHRFSSPQQRERARKSTLAGQSAFAATRDLITFFLASTTRMIGLEDERE